MSLNTILATTPLTSTGYHLKATGTTIGNSLIWDNGTNVGIGNTNTSYTLDVSGTGRFTSTLLVSGAATFSGFVGINGSSATAFPLEAYINSATAYSSTSRGNVMRVYNSNTGANIFAGIELGGAGTANDGLAGLNAVVTGSGSAALTFYTRDSNTFAEKVRITSAGNVGIGTTGPSTLLHINTTARTSGTNVNMITLSDTVTGVQTSGYGVRIVGTSNNGSAVSAIAFEADGGTNNDTAIAFYTQSTAGALTRRVTINRGGQLRITQAANGHSGDGLSLFNTANEIWNFVNGGDSNLYLGFQGNSKGVFAYTTGVYTALSDKNKKKDFEASTIGLNSILGLKPTLYRMKTDDESLDKHLGFIAQEVKEFIPQAYEEFGEGENKFIGLNYNAIVAALVKAVQEQNQTIQSLQEQINILAK